MKYHITFIILVCFFAGVFFLGYTAGKKSVIIEESTEIKYVDLPAISIPFKPIEIGCTVPDVPQYIWKTEIIKESGDTVYVADSSAIVYDWTLRREYVGSYYNDTVGTAKYQIFVQYNEMDSIRVDLAPKQREVINNRTAHENFIPFLFLGYGNKQFSVEGGFFLEKYGFAIEIGNDFHGNNYFGGKVGIRF